MLFKKFKKTNQWFKVCCKPKVSIGCETRFSANTLL